jgi:hypothetical protein
MNVKTIQNIAGNQSKKLNEVQQNKVVNNKLQKEKIK